MQTPEIPRYDQDGDLNPDGPFHRVEDVDAAFAALPDGTLTDPDVDRIRRALVECLASRRR